MARDYSLVGQEGQRAQASGLATAQWYATPIERKQLKQLMKRSDQPAIRDTLIWLGLMVLAGSGMVLTWGSGWTLPFVFVYGVLFGSADSRWHEAGHGTAFKTRWMNEWLYQLASFMIFREPDVWRWSHTRHHTDTIVVGRDPEIAAPRPPDLLGMLANVFALKSSWLSAVKLWLHARGRLTAEESSFIPESEHQKVFRTARIWLLILGAVVLFALLLQSWLPLMLIGLPTLYGGYLVIFFGLTQHAGLAEDVLDHRLNTRTVYMNPVFRFLYWNMNYHLEHHMYPLVPYHALPALHEAIKDDCPPPYPSIWAAYREIIPALLKQRHDPAYFVRRSPG